MSDLIAIRKAKLSMSKYTIAIPTYKRYDLLRQSIDSAINQLGNIKYEVLIIDNDPTRNCNTESIIRSIKNNNISYYKNVNNIGMVGNWNKLFELAIGEYVIMLHDDDVLASNYLIEINKFILKKNEEVDVVFPCYEIIYGDGNTMQHCQGSDPTYYYMRVTTLSLAIQNIVGPPIGMCVKKSKHFETSGFDQSYYPSIDYAYYVNLSLIGKCFKIKTMVTTYYRIHVNETMNPETLRMFTKVDSIIKDNILSSVVPRLFHSVFRRHRKIADIIYEESLLNKFGKKDISLIDDSLQRSKVVTLDSICYYIIEVFYRFYHFYQKRHMSVKVGH